MEKKRMVLEVQNIKQIIKAEPVALKQKHTLVVQGMKQTPGVKFKK